MLVRKKASVARYVYAYAVRLALVGFWSSFVVVIVGGVAVDCYCVAAATHWIACQ